MLPVVGQVALAI